LFLKNKINILEIKNKLEYKNKFNHKIHNSSLLKWDILYLWENKNFIADAKDYKETDSRMKFPYKTEKNNFIKTIDSNIKYLSHFNFIINNKDCLDIFKKIFNREIINKDTTNDFKFIINKDEFLKLFYFFEYGVLNEELNINWKYIISNISENKDIDSVQIRKLTINEKLEWDIIVEFNIMNNSYLYFNFYNNNELFYSLSQRSYKEGKWYPQWNCWFINKKYIIENTININ